MNGEQRAAKWSPEELARLEQLKQERRVFDARVAHWLRRYQSDDPPAPPTPGDTPPFGEYEVDDATARFMGYTIAHLEPRVASDWESSLDALSDALAGDGFPRPHTTVCVKHGNLDVDDEVAAHLIALDSSQPLTERIAALMRVGPRGSKQMRATHARCIEPVLAAWIDQNGPAGGNDELEGQIKELLRQATTGALDENLRVISAHLGWEECQDEANARVERLVERAASRSSQVLVRFEAITPARPLQYG